MVVRARRVLAVGGDLPRLEKARACLVDRGYEVDIDRSASECLRKFASQSTDLVVVSLPLGDGRGADFLRSLQGIDAQAKVVVTGRDDQVRDAGEAFRLGASEYVEGTTDDISDLLDAVGALLGARRSDIELRWLRERDAVGASWSAIAGASPEIREVVDTLRRVCERTIHGPAPTIHLRGEAGSGKGLLAKCIHYGGVRRNHAFVEINCAATPRPLLEAELFGYERGAFADGKSSRAGLLETAHQGTLFFDEIGSLPLDLQAKVLMAIEEKRARLLGGRETLHLDLQTVAASHIDLKDAVQKGQFRTDLYQRLNVVSVTVPPLRRRGQDKLILARMFLESLSRQYCVPMPKFAADAETFILEYSWPGNIRELRNQIERIVLLGNGETILRAHFDRAAGPPPSARESKFPIAMPEGGIGLEEVERELIRRALARFDGNVSRAARYLKVSRQTLIYRIKKHRLGS